MASSVVHSLLSAILLFLSFPTNAQTPFKPKTLVLPISKDVSTLQYTTQIKQRTPLVPIKLVIDLGGMSVWVDCEQGYVSSSYRFAPCGSAQCTLARASQCNQCFQPRRPGCNNNTCDSTPYNTFTLTSTSGDLSEDVVAIQSTNESALGPQVTISRLLFTCAPSFLLDKLANGSVGIAALGNNLISLPSQFASAFRFNRNFAICLPSSTTSNGVIYFGNGPYIMPPNVNISASLTYTSILINPVGPITSGEASAEFYIPLKSIAINGKSISLNRTFLSIRKNGSGGTTISTAFPYSLLHHSLYKPFTQAFINAALSMKLTRVASVAPFGVCFNSKNITKTRVGPAVPTIDLVLHNKNVSWRIFGANSMVQVKDDVFCLGFIDRGLTESFGTRNASIVIAGYQLENNLLHFDLGKQRLGFSSSLLLRQTTCSNFNFAS